MVVVNNLVEGILDFLNSLDSFGVLFVFLQKVVNVFISLNLEVNSELFTISTSLQVVDSDGGNNEDISQSLISFLITSNLTQTLTQSRILSIDSGINIMEVTSGTNGRFSISSEGGFSFLREQFRADVLLKNIEIQRSNLAEFN